MGSKGSNTSTTTSTPNPQAMAAYSGALKDANQAYNWGMQYTPNKYTGELVAGLVPEQYQGIGGINQYANAAQPAIGTAEDWTRQAAQDITPQQIQKYMSPYTQNVVDKTQAEFNRQNQIGLQNVRGNAISQGAFGGNREAIAEDQYYANVLPGQQQTIAGLYNQAYGSGLNTALTEQQNLANRAYGLGNLAASGQNLGLTGANAQIGAGGLEQGTQQALDTALWNKYMMTGAYPMQLASANAGIASGIGSQMGGTSTTTGPPPSMLSQIAGLGTAGVGLFGSTGAVPYMFGNRGGAVKGYDSGGFITNPYIPNVNIAHGSGPPKPPSAPSQPAQNPLQGLGTLGTALGGKGGLVPALGSAFGSGATALGEAMPEVGAALADAAPFIGLALNSGGEVPGYDDGGGVLPSPDPTGMLPYSKPQGIYPLQYPSFKGYIPNVNISHGSGIPKPPSLSNQTSDLNKQAQQIGSLTKAIMGDRSSLAAQDAAQDAQQDAEEARRGGRIHGYAYGGGPSGSLGGWSGADDYFNDSPESGVLYPPQDRGDFPPNALPNDPMYTASLEEPTSKVGIGNHPPLSGYSGSLGIPNNSVWPDDLPSSGSLGQVPRNRQYKLGDMDPYDPKNPMYGFNPTRGGDIGSQIQKAYKPPGTPDDDFVPPTHSKDPIRDFEGNGVSVASLVDKYSPTSAALSRKLADTGDVRVASESPFSSLTAYRRPGAEQPKSRGLSGMFSGIDLSANSKLWPALIMAGGSMMASPSPFAGVGIGQGIQQGAKTYNELYEQEKKHNLTQQEIDQKSKQLSQQADQFNRKLEEQNKERMLALQKPMVMAKDRYGQPVYGRMDDHGKLFNLDGTPFDAKKNAQENEIAQSSGEDYLKTLPPEEAAYLRKVRNYDAALPTQAGTRNPIAAKMRDDFYHAYPTEYNEAMYPVYNKAKQQFFSGPRGDTIKSFNVSMFHLDSLKKAMDALDHGDYPAFNALMDWYKKETGKAAPTNATAVRNIVADEIVRAVIGSKGALSDREATQDTAAIKASPEQAHGVIDKYKELMSGQLMGLKQQFTSSTNMPGEIFDNFLLPTTRQQLMYHEQSGAGVPQRGVPTVNQEAFNKLPSGAKFIAEGDPTQTVRTKP